MFKAPRREYPSTPLLRRQAVPSPTLELSGRARAQLLPFRSLPHLTSRSDLIFSSYCKMSFCCRLRPWNAFRKQTTNERMAAKKENHGGEKGKGGVRRIELGRCSSTHRQQQLDRRCYSSCGGCSLDVDGSHSSTASPCMHFALCLTFDVAVCYRFAYAMEKMRRSVGRLHTRTHLIFFTVRRGARGRGSLAWSSNTNHRAKCYEGLGTMLQRYPKRCTFYGYSAFS